MTWSVGKTFWYRMVATMTRPYMRHDTLRSWHCLSRMHSDTSRQRLWDLNFHSRYLIITDFLNRESYYNSLGLMLHSDAVKTAMEARVESNKMKEKDAAQNASSSTATRNRPQYQWVYELFTNCISTSYRMVSVQFIPIYFQGHRVLQACKTFPLTFLVCVLNMRNSGTNPLMWGIVRIFPETFWRNLRCVIMSSWLREIACIWDASSMLRASRICPIPCAHPKARCVHPSKWPCWLCATVPKLTLACISFRNDGSRFQSH